MSTEHFLAKKYQKKIKNNPELEGKVFYLARKAAEQEKERQSTESRKPRKKDKYSSGLSGNWRKTLGRKQNPD